MNQIAAVVGETLRATLQQVIVICVLWGILGTRAIRNVTNFVTQVNHVTRSLENARTVNLVDMENIVQNIVAELVKT